MPDFFDVEINVLQVYWSRFMYKFFTVTMYDIHVFTRKQLLLQYINISQRYSKCDFFFFKNCLWYQKVKKKFLFLFELSENFVSNCYRLYKQCRRWGFWFFGGFFILFFFCLFCFFPQFPLGFTQFTCLSSLLKKILDPLYKYMYRCM
jgi:hypothetical protein